MIQQTLDVLSHLKKISSDYQTCGLERLTFFRIFENAVWLISMNCCKAGERAAVV